MVVEGKFHESRLFELSTNNDVSHWIICKWYKLLIMRRFERGNKDFIVLLCKNSPILFQILQCHWYKMCVHKAQAGTWVIMIICDNYACNPRIFQLINMQFRIITFSENTHMYIKWSKMYASNVVQLENYAFWLFDQFHSDYPKVYFVMPFRTLL